MKYWLIEKTLMLGKIEGWRRREQQRMRWLDGITDTMDIGLGTYKTIFKNQSIIVSSSFDSKILYFTLGEKAPDLRFSRVSQP